MAHGSLWMPQSATEVRAGQPFLFYATLGAAQGASVRHRPRVLEVGLGFEEVGVAASVDLDP